MPKNTACFVNSIFLLFLINLYKNVGLQLFHVIVNHISACTPYQYSSPLIYRVYNMYIASVSIEASGYGLHSKHLFCR